MVLEVIVIGGAIYYYVKKNKENRAKKAAWAIGQPWTHKDGSTTYPPSYSTLPPQYDPTNDHKMQAPLPTQHEYYADAASVKEKQSLVAETREIMMPSKEKS